MLNFLNSTVLFAAAAALIPLIIHLLSKRKVKVIEFSSLKHLKSMQRRQVRKLKLRQLLLLITRMLIILAVVLAFARPTTEGGSLGSHASVSAVIILDNSASMDRYVTDGNLFEIAKRRASSLLDTFGDADEVSLLPLAGELSSDQYAPFSSAATSREKLGRLQVSYQSVDLQTTLQSAADLLARAVNLNKEVYLITDRQRSGLGESHPLENVDATVYFVDLPVENDENCGVVSVDFGGQLITPGHDFDLTAQVRNYSGSDRNDIIASLFIDGSRVAQTDLNVAAGEQAPVRFTRSVSTTGFHSGYVELSDDKFLVDNRYYFSFTIPERFNLLIVDGDGTGRLMALALSPSEAINQYWSVKTASPENLAAVNFWDYDVIFLAGAPNISESYLRRLKIAVGQRKSVLLTYGPKTDIGNFNDVWSEQTGVVFDKPVEQNPSRAGYYTLASFELQHPIFSVFDADKGKLPDVKFYALPSLHTAAGVETLLRFTGDRPALVEGAPRGGRVLTFTGPLDPRYSDMTGHAFFVPFISRIAEYLAADLSAYDLRLFCSDKITRAISLEGPVVSSLDLVAPDSSFYSLPVDDNEGVLSVAIGDADKPGIYRMYYRGREIDRFAVNVDPNECNLTAIDRDEYAEVIGADKLNVLGGNVEFATAVAEFRYGKELWQLFMWLAVILVAVEIVLSRGQLAEESQ